MNNQIKTPEQILSEHSKNYGAIEHNPRAVVKASEALDAMKECAKQLLEEYTNRIVENTHICLRKYPTLIEEDFGQEITTERENEYYGIHKESITSQLPKFLKENNLI